MGSFSWMLADNNTAQDNIVPGDEVKFLIPREFGGGFVRGTYEDYGVLKCDEYDFDIYGVLAYFNSNQMIRNQSVRELLTYDGEFPTSFDAIVKTGDTHRHENRCLGIRIGCYDEQMSRLHFPLKLVSIYCNDTYEECAGISVSDPNQGFYPTYREGGDVHTFMVCVSRTGVVYVDAHSSEEARNMVSEYPLKEITWGSDFEIEAVYDD